MLAYTLTLSLATALVFGTLPALRASPADVLRLVIGQAARATALGLALGVAGALVAARLLAGNLYGMTATGPLTFAAMPALLALAALLASWLPARGATRVDPVEALRAD